MYVSLCLLDVCVCFCFVCRMTRTVYVAQILLFQYLLVRCVHGFALVCPCVCMLLLYYNFCVCVFTACLFCSVHPCVRLFVLYIYVLFLVCC